MAWLKKFKLRCSQQVFVLLDWRFIEYSRTFTSIWYVFVSIFRENNWLEKTMLTWKKYQFTVGATLISKIKKIRWWKRYLSSVNCSFTEMSKNPQIRKRQWSIILILFGLKSRWVKIEYILLYLIVGVGVE